MVKQSWHILAILRLQVYDTTTFDSLVHSDPNFGQMNFDISLTKGNINDIKNMLELKMAWLPSGGHDKVLAQFGNLAPSKIEILRG